MTYIREFAHFCVFAAAVDVRRQSGAENSLSCVLSCPQYVPGVVETF